jgi:hypothetical protein
MRDKEMIMTKIPIDTIWKVIHICKNIRVPDKDYEIEFDDELIIRVEP